MVLSTCNPAVTMQHQTGSSPNLDKKPSEGERVKFKFLAAGVLAMAVVGASAQNLTGAGATFPYPIYSKWFSEYAQQHPTVKINYQSIGSGRRIRHVSEGTVDFGRT